MKIAILDSGVRKGHPAFESKAVEGFSLKVTETGEIQKGYDFEDTIGHGTAVYYLIKCLIPIADIVNIKIYFDQAEIHQSDFEYILEFIYNNFQFDIINISMGIVNCCSTMKMQAICDKFYQRNTIIVSAFDNEGAVSFPAALDHVVGVDGSESLLDIKDYIIKQNSIVNIVGKSKYQKVAWTFPDYNIVKGNSFTCCYVTAIISNLLQNNGSKRLQELLFSGKSIHHTTEKLPFKIINAAAFPFNKEIHALAGNEGLLSFNMVAYYSAAESGQVGRRISSVLGYTANQRTIQDVSQIDWESFDTLIIGHLNQLETLTRHDYSRKLINLACEHHKNIYSFDTIEVSKELHKNNIYIAKAAKEQIVKSEKKLFQTNIPIICVCGTNSRQGKYSLQLYFRKRLNEIGYKVGQLGTEPSAILFGMDEMFHCGYNQHIPLRLEEIYLLINQMLWNITNNNPEIILTGCQSGVLPYSYSNIKYFPTIHRICLEAMQPDVVVLCINPFDDIEYVRRTVYAIEGVTRARVIGCVCYPKDYSEDWKGNFSKTVRISKEKEEMIKNSYKKKLGLNVYMLDVPQELDDLLISCLEYMS